MILIFWMKIWYQVKRTSTAFCFGIGILEKIVKMLAVDSSIF